MNKNKIQFIDIDENAKAIFIPKKTTKQEMQDFFAQVEDKLSIVNNLQEYGNWMVECTEGKNWISFDIKILPDEIFDSEKLILSFLWEGVNEPPNSDNYLLTYMPEMVGHPTSEIEQELQENALLVLYEVCKEQ